MKFHCLDFLEDHIRSILQFYEPIVLDKSGGFFHNFQDDGTIFDKKSRHLVSSARFIFNYAEAYRRGLGDHYCKWVRHGLKFIEEVHLRPRTNQYAWQVGLVRDEAVYAYGHAFVLLAHAKALVIGESDSILRLRSVDQFLLDQFFEPENAAFADERSADLAELSPYRGQNANMHLCEAYIAAYKATTDRDFLLRAQSLAKRFASDLASLAGGLIWEHYHSDWTIDWDYNRDKPGDLFKPWGFQPGHQVEWAKLLLQLNEIENNNWYIRRASELFDRALEHGWDNDFGGIVYGFAPDGSFADDHKYFWVHAEAFAAAYRLYVATKDEKYLAWYEKIWAYSWEYMIDHVHGAWFRIRNRRGQAIDNLKSPMGKVDYHTLGACWDVIDQIKIGMPARD